MRSSLSWKNTTGGCEMVSARVSGQRWRGEQEIDSWSFDLAENQDHEGKRKNESLWPIMRIVHTRSRYIYDLYYEREAISKELYDWLLKEGYGDAKWVSLEYY